VFLDRNDPLQALAAVDLLTVLSPDAPDLVRTRGLVLARLDCVAAAMADLRRYLTLVPDAADVEVIRSELDRLARASVTVH
jgi:regulator of sirC expression with transglutaminase-like and TPR domain